MKQLEPSDIAVDNIIKRSRTLLEESTIASSSSMQDLQGQFT